MSKTFLAEFWSLRGDAAQERDGSAAAVARLAQWMADVGDGLVLAEELESAHSAETIAAALTKQGRQMPRIGGVVLNRQRWCFLSSAGWREAGQPSRRSAPPTASTVSHRSQIHAVARWMENRLGTALDAYGVATGVLSGPALRADIRSRVEGWKAARYSSGGGVGSSVLAGGCFPDLVVIQSWPANAQEWRHALWNPLAPANESLGDGPEVRIAVEVETAAKGTLALVEKCRRLQAAYDEKWFHGCLFLLDDPRTAAVLERALRAENAPAALSLRANLVDIGYPSAGRLALTNPWPGPSLVASFSASPGAIAKQPNGSGSAAH